MRTWNSIWKCILFYLFRITYLLSCILYILNCIFCIIYFELCILCGILYIAYCVCNVKYIVYFVICRDKFETISNYLYNCVCVSNLQYNFYFPFKGPYIQFLHSMSAYMYHSHYIVVEIVDLLGHRKKERKRKCVSANYLNTGLLTCNPLMQGKVSHRLLAIRAGMGYSANETTYSAIHKA